MTLSSDLFLFVFLPVVFVLFWSLRKKAQRHVLLALAGYVFYASWDWRYCALLLYTSLLNFGAGLAIERSTTDRARRSWLSLAIASDLLLLGFFKYYNFFSHSLSAAVPGVALPLLHLALPLGISFYTFTTISYVVEVASGRIEANRNLWAHLAYVNFFPKVIAGPITRFHQLKDDLEHLDDPPREEWFARGVGFFIVGLLKKVMIADHIGRGIDPLLASYATMSAGQAWTAAVGYAAQLYFDFSGYSDMAVGLGCLFGLRLPQNFNRPYLSPSLTEMWRRWHISLNSWLFDYIYLPLTTGGGWLRGRFRTVLMIVFLASGLWHGAGWTFILWGALQGVGMVVHYQWGEFYRSLCRRDRSWVQVRKGRPYLTASWALTQSFFLVTLVLFRSVNLPMAGSWLRAMFAGPWSRFPLGGLGLGWIAAALLWIALVPEPWDFRFSTRPRWALAYAAAFVAMYFFMNGTDTVFLYRQF